MGEAVQGCFCTDALTGISIAIKNGKDKLYSAVNKINAIISNADEGLFRDFPDIGNKGCNIFYGSLRNAPRDELDEEIIALAEKDAQSLFDIREKK